MEKNSLQKNKCIATITCVERIKWKTGCYLIHLDGVPSFEVHEDTMIKFRLLKGSELSPDSLTEILRVNKENKAYIQAIKYLHRKPRTRGELARNLTQKGYEDIIIQEVLDRLEREWLVDDKSYAMEWANQRLYGHMKGRHCIQHDLEQKGVHNPYIQWALHSIDPNEEWNSALHAARKKWYQTKGELHLRRQKVVAFLVRRGYPMDMAERAADEQVLKEETSSDIY